MLELSGSSTSFTGGACGVLELFGVATSFATPSLPWLVCCLPCGGSAVAAPTFPSSLLLCFDVDIATCVLRRI